jgi:hypothetical protein
MRKCYFLFSRCVYLAATLFLIPFILSSCAQQRIAMRSLKENIEQAFKKGGILQSHLRIATGKVIDE